MLKQKNFIFQVYKCSIFDKKIKHNIMKEIEKFHEWMVKIGNKYLYDNEQMCNAYNKIKQ